MSSKSTTKTDGAKSTSAKPTTELGTPPIQTKRASITKETESAAKSIEKQNDKKETSMESDQETEKYFAEEFTAEDRLKQYAEIEQEISARPLIGWKEVGFDSLYEELKSSPQFTRKLPYLSTKYFALRRVRGDGNCFYRGFMFRLVETLLIQYLDNNKRVSILFTKIKSKVDTALQYLLNSNYEEHSVEFFVDIAKSFFDTTTLTQASPNSDSFESDEIKFPTNEVELEMLFADPNKSMYLVWFCKLLSAAFIKQHWTERFAFFVEGPEITAEEFCRKEVEPTDCEAGQIQITALCEYFQVKICVEYLDASENKDETASYYFGPEEETVNISLLYRPGHYDIIYSNNDLN